MAACSCFNFATLWFWLGSFGSIPGFPIPKLLKVDRKLLSAAFDYDLFNMGSFATLLALGDYSSPKLILGDPSLRTIFLWFFLTISIGYRKLWLCALGPSVGALGYENVSGMTRMPPAEPGRIMLGGICNWASRFSSSFYLRASFSRSRF